MEITLGILILILYNLSGRKITEDIIQFPVSEQLIYKNVNSPPLFLVS
jgi:hypothetical protein